MASIAKSHELLGLVGERINRQPAFVVYSRSGTEGPWAAHSIQVLSLEQNAISGLTLFVKPAGPQLFQAFGLPLILPDAGVQMPSAPYDT